MQWNYMAVLAAGILVLNGGTVRAQDEEAPGQNLKDRYIVRVKGGIAPETVSGRHGIAAQSHFHAVANGFAARVPAQALQAMLLDDDVEMIVADREVFAIGKPAVSGSGTTSSQTLPAGVQRIGAVRLSYKGDGVGVVGVAPLAKVYAVKVLDKNGNGTDSSIIAGLDWVAKNAAVVTPAIKVVNISLGRPGTLNDNPVLRLAVASLTQMGITVVVAAGNDPKTEVSQQVPATYPEVIAVASTTARNGVSQYRGFSSITADTASYFTTDGNMVPAPDGSGYIGVTISAPGEDQEDVSRTGVISSVGILSLKVGGGTTRMSGTSMAAPHVAGVAALLQQKYGGTLTTEALREKIVLGASNPAAPYDSPTTSYTFDGDREGILDAPGALAVP